ncbi:carbonic anhydrase 2-like [Musca autumnalis]|uniref:carbonic anhydrase 2-like n=1 Tax=Musca autumnalis TaxID=221902 RepID=UPI003CF5D9F0
MYLKFYKRILFYIAFQQIVFNIAVKAAVTSGRTVCNGKYIRPYNDDEEDEEIEIVNKTFSPLLCENCNETSLYTILTNNGRQLLINMTYNSSYSIPLLSNGPLEGKGKYRVHGINFNWLYRTPAEWSWHDVMFPAELHILFFNMKYKDFETAVNANEGVAILSMIFHVNQNMSSFLMSSMKLALTDVIHPYTNIVIPIGDDNITLNNFLPRSIELFHTYEGTMTMHDTPWQSNCKAKVIWIDIDESLNIHPDDVMEFKKLLNFRRYPQFPQVERYKSPTGIIYSSQIAKEAQNNEGVNMGSNVWYFVVIMEIFVHLCLRCK